MIVIFFCFRLWLLIVFFFVECVRTSFMPHGLVLTSVWRLIGQKHAKSCHYLCMSCLFLWFYDLYQVFVGGDVTKNEWMFNRNLFINLFDLLFLNELFFRITWHMICIFTCNEILWKSINFHVSPHYLNKYGKKLYWKAYNFFF